MGTIFSHVACIRSVERKPAGGFRFIRARSILAVWCAMAEGLISVYDVRIWLACHEIVSRRCQIGKGKRPDYRPSELVPLLGTGRDAKVRKGIERLENAGLLAWDAGGVELDTKKCEAQGQNTPEWGRLLASVANNKRKVPVPRRMICYLARSRSRTVIATVLGHLLRCLYYRKGQCLSGGRCKASWIAEVFGVDVRNVKAARKVLVGLGWLEPGKAGQVLLNRWGMPMAVNLSWGLPGKANETKSPPRRSRSLPKSPPPESYTKLFSRNTNQKLGGTAGAEMGSGERSRPTLKRICLEDLRVPGRLDCLYRQAADAGMVRHSAAGRLQWFGAAEHAMEAGDRNPCGLFVALCRRDLWHHITQAQEDAARLKLKKLDFGEEPAWAGSTAEFAAFYGELAA